MKKKIIAIDGYASTGKSSLAKQLSIHLNYIYVNSGSMYRAITLYAINKKLTPLNEKNIIDLINALYDIKLDYIINKSSKNSDIYLNGLNVEKQINSLEVSDLVSLVAEIPQIRRFVVKIQKSFKSKKGLVMDGRDIGSIVFPDADLKLFLTASDKVRAKRRYDELNKEGYDVEYDDILHNIITRDKKDSERKDSPLIIAEDAIVIDNSDLTIEEQVDTVLKIIESNVSF
tara:strand:+ start:1262 stop:1951 length:690 start_codon:yes stop_codon:yes gene_type:complete